MDIHILWFWVDQLPVYLSELGGGIVGALVFSAIYEKSNCNRLANFDSRLFAILWDI